MFKIIECTQGTEEWFAARKGKMTASHATAIGNCGKGLDTYAHEVVAGHFETAREEGFTSDYMERGKELEDQARNLYEIEKEVTVQQVGFIELDEWTGCSPDGLVGEDGGLEIKCKKNVEHAKAIMYGKIDTGHEWQVQMNLLITGRQWWDYALYNPNFKKNLLIFRIVPDKEKQEKLKAGLAQGKAQIEALKKLM